MEKKEKGRAVEVGGGNDEKETEIGWMVPHALSSHYPHDLSHDECLVSFSVSVLFQPQEKMKPPPSSPSQAWSGFSRGRPAESLGSLLRKRGRPRLA